MLIHLRTSRGLKTDQQSACLLSSLQRAEESQSAIVCASDVTSHVFQHSQCLKGVG